MSKTPAHVLHRLDQAIEHQSAEKDQENTLAALQAAKEALTAQDGVISQQRDLIERQEFALAYLASCTAATAEALLGRKSTPKSELARHRRICEMLLKALEGEALDRHISSTAIIGAETRLRDVIAELPV